jgi:hypothetical protein
MPLFAAVEVRAAPLLAAFLLAGCAAAPTPAPSIFIRFESDIGGVCVATTTLAGMLVNDPDVGLAMKDDGGNVTPVIWSFTRGYSPRQAGTQVEILDGSGRVVATTGRKYTFLGQYWLGGTNKFWVCADPQTQD